jgi:hypothetical protein
MSRHLSVSDIEAILGMVDCIDGCVTWQRLIDEIELRLGRRYTKQGLSKHGPIKAALKIRREASHADAGERPVRTSPELDLAEQKISKQEARISRLAAENDRLIERFIRWAYNASKHGLSEAQLDAPLLSVNRGQSDR